ncbi:MAG TPA: multidrug RND transporter, partial [Rhodanobacteraceae bacterium]|nr:multidrug RND transporter [Rhodanobacteraceae bacterium]
MNIPIRRGNFAVAVLATVLLAGCASTGGLHPTATPTNPASLAAQRSFSGARMDAAAWPQQGWWKVLGDAQLDELVDEALADNPDMTLVDARV